MLNLDSIQFITFFQIDCDMSFFHVTTSAGKRPGTSSRIEIYFAVLAIVFRKQNYKVLFHVFWFGMYELVCTVNKVQQ